MNWLLALMVVVVALLHQDFWLWTDKRLVLGFVPIGHWSTTMAYTLRPSSRETSTHAPHIAAAL